MFIKFLQSILYTVWIVVGVALLIFSVKAYQSWPDNGVKGLFSVATITTGSPAAETRQASTPGQQPTQITQEHLTCIQKILGQQRTSDVTSGKASLADDEKTKIQPCLATSSAGQTAAPVGQAATTGSSPIQQGSPTNSTPISPGTADSTAVQGGVSPQHP